MSVKIILMYTSNQLQVNVMVTEFIRKRQGYHKLHVLNESFSVVGQQREGIKQTSLLQRQFVDQQSGVHPQLIHQGLLKNEKGI
jgi:hypothetical protein